MDFDINVSTFEFNQHLILTTFKIIIIFVCSNLQITLNSKKNPKSPANVHQTSAPKKDKETKTKDLEVIFFLNIMDSKTTNSLCYAQRANY